jgi:hypothetical protein
MKTIVVEGKEFKYEIAKEFNVVKFIIVWADNTRYMIPAILGHETTTWRGKNGSQIWGKKEVAEVIKSNFFSKH